MSDLNRAAIPVNARLLCAELIEELRRRFRPRFWNVASVARSRAVRQSVIEPIEKALLVDSMEQLHRAASDYLDFHDDIGTDYSFLRDLKARVRVIEFEAIYAREHDGAPTPP